MRDFVISVAVSLVRQAWIAAHNSIYRPCFNLCEPCIIYLQLLYSI